jgi:DNA mismatch repair ATPase MutL
VQLDREGAVVDVARLAPGPRGTTFTVEGLFASFPGRLERVRQKSAKQQKDIHSLVSAYALVNPRVEFELRAGGQTLFKRAPISDTGPDADGEMQPNYSSAISKLFGRDFVQQLCEFRMTIDDDADADADAPAIKIHGYFPARREEYEDRPDAGIQAFRSNNDRQFYFVNGVVVCLSVLSLFSSCPSLFCLFCFLFVFGRLRNSLHSLLSLFLFSLSKNTQDGPWTSRTSAK